MSNQKSLVRNGGYSPSQWVPGKAPREAPSLVSEDQFAHLGAIEDQVDPESRFAFQHQARLEVKKAFIHLHTFKRVQRALLRSAKPIPKTFSIGDVVCFRRDNQPGRTTWSPASRVIGHEGKKNQNVLVLCENILVLVSAQNIRPAGDAVALAHAILHGHSTIPEAHCTVLGLPAGEIHRLLVASKHLEDVGCPGPLLTTSASWKHVPKQIMFRT